MSQERAPSQNITLSNVGHCRRQLAYKRLGFPTLPIDPVQLPILHDGTALHEVIRALLLKAGVKLHDIEKRVVAPLGLGINIKGAIDGIVDINDESFLLEIKTASVKNFWRMIKGDLGFEYLAQVQASLVAVGLNAAIVLLKNKEKGTFGEVIVYKDEAIIEALQKRITEVMAATPENLPPKDYGPDEKGVYPWACIGCSWRLPCWGSEDLKVKYND